MVRERSSPAAPLHEPPVSRVHGPGLVRARARRQISRWPAPAANAAGQRAGSMIVSRRAFQCNETITCCSRARARYIQTTSLCSLTNLLNVEKFAQGDSHSLPAESNQTGAPLAGCVRAGGRRSLDEPKQAGSGTRPEPTRAARLVLAHLRPPGPAWLGALVLHNILAARKSGPVWPGAITTIIMEPRGLGTRSPAKTKSHNHN